MGGLDQAFIKAFSHTSRPSPTGSDAEQSQRWSPPAPHARFAAEMATAPAACDEKHAAAAVAMESAISSATFDVARGWAVSFDTMDEPATAAHPPKTSRPAAWPAESFRALLEVEHFLWPELVARLDPQTVRPMRELVQELSAASAAGRKILLMVGDDRGCGTTTLVLAAARYLARQGHKVAIVDANSARPDLAQFLGIAAQVGWEDVMTRQTSLAEVLVESIADRLTLLAIKSPISLVEGPIDLAVAADNLRQLRRHFDLVLVDGGARTDAATRHLLARLGAEVLDGVVGVAKERAVGDVQPALDATTSALFDRLQIGVIENFVANS